MKVKVKEWLELTKEERILVLEYAVWRKEKAAV